MMSFLRYHCLHQKNAKRKINGEINRQMSDTQNYRGGYGQNPPREREIDQRSTSPHPPRGGRGIIINETNLSLRHSPPHPGRSMGREVSRRRAETLQWMRKIVRSRNSEQAP